MSKTSKHLPTESFDETPLILAITESMLQDFTEEKHGRRLTTKELERVPDALSDSVRVFIEKLDVMDAIVTYAIGQE